MWWVYVLVALLIFGIGLVYLLWPFAVSLHPKKLLQLFSKKQLVDDQQRRELCDAMYGRYRLSFLGCPEMSPEKLKEMRGKPMVILVDCRDEDEQEVSMIKDAITQGEFERRYLSPTPSETLRDHVVVCYCTIGMRSGLYAKQLGAKYAVDAWNLKAGILAWLHAGGEVIQRNTGKPANEVHVYGKTWDIAPKAFTTHWR